MENKKINYWIIPQIKRIKVLPATQKSEGHLSSNIVSIVPVYGIINFFKNAVNLTGLKVGDKIKFIFIDDLLFVYKSNDGVGLRYRNKKLLIGTQSRPLGKILRETLILMKRKHTEAIRCKIEKTNSEFNGSPLFEIKLPKQVLKKIKIDY